MWELIGAADRALFQALTAWHSSALDAAFVWFETSGGGGLIWLTLGVAAFVRPRDRAAAWRVMLTVGLAYVVGAWVLKPLVGRERPAPLVTPVMESASASPGARVRTLPPMPRSHSFPSDRATAAFGAAVVVSRMWPRATILWWMCAALIGYGRIYLGHHYPFDVLGGAVVGIATAFWVLGGRHPATDARTLPWPPPPGVVVRP